MEQIETGDLEKLQMLQYKVTERHLAEIWRKFKEFNLNPILIKGLAASKYYPQPFKRHIGDYDIAISPEQFQEAVELVERESLTKVDLHEGLRHLDTVEWDDLYKNSIEIFCDDVEIRVLRPEDHLRVLVVHWLTDGGEYFEKLRDIFYLVENRRAEFDWDRCLGKVGKNRQRWIIITLGLVSRYLGLDLEGLPFAAEARNLPDWMIVFLEREWKRGYRLMPIHNVLHNRKDLWKQLEKRFPPNPIQAVVDVEGSLDSKFHFYYQMGSIWKRIFPSIKRIWRSFR